eukprot:1711965-Rhodomonas_salina.1
MVFGADLVLARARAAALVARTRSPVPLQRRLARLGPPHLLRNPLRLAASLPPRTPHLGFPP